MINLLWSVVTDFIGLRWLLFNSLISIIIYQFVFKNWSYFSRNNVKFVRGPPILGAQWRVLVGLESFTNSVERMYNYFSHEKLTGIIDVGGKCAYIVRDPELIKQIAIKDFDHFMNHRFYVDSNSDPLFGRSLFILRDQQWKIMRSHLSPAFTGSKMRLMFSLIGNVSNSFCDYLKNDLKSGPIDCDIRDLFGRFANDAIASCAFGIDIDSMKDKDNEFYKSGLSLSNFSGVKNFVKMMIVFLFPKSGTYLNVTFFNPKDSAYFREIVLNNIKYREQNGIVRNDMINLLMQMKKGTLTKSAADSEGDGDIGFATAQESSFEKVSTNQLQEWQDDDLVAQCLLFFLGGFGTVSLTLSFLAHDLAVHQDVQSKLYGEIREIKEKLNGKSLTYEALQKMKYLDMVLSESMRMWTQNPISDRIVNKQYELEIDDNRKLVLNPGDIILLPSQGLHMDEKYFPNPKKFQPERFSDENKDNIIPGTYMPFGIGPRNCIASRFALMECKACIFNLLSNCKLEMCEKTQHPMKLKIATGQVEAEKGYWLKIKLRN